MKIFLKVVLVFFFLLAVYILFQGISRESIVLITIAPILGIVVFFQGVYIEYGAVTMVNIKKYFMFNLQRIQRSIGGSPSPIQVKSVEDFISIFQEETCQKINIYAQSNYLSAAQIFGSNKKEYRLDFYVTTSNKKLIVYSVLLFVRIENTNTLSGAQDNFEAEEKLQLNGKQAMEKIKATLPHIAIKLFDADSNEIEEKLFYQKNMTL